ncbi:MAG: YcgL domain-containing protein [Porticoccaceae bacterium]|nr:YcgL domain-containing protein [Porticoccaceae bacterium]
MILCDIYKGNKKSEMYLYVPSDTGTKEVPEVLLQSFGELTLVMKIKLSKSRKLARVDVATVIDDIQQKGFYLQVPPSTWNGPEGHTQAKE